LKVEIKKHLDNRYKKRVKQMEAEQLEANK